MKQLNFTVETEAEKNAEDMCHISNKLDDECDGQSAKDWLSIVVVFVGIFLIGVGNACIISLGMPYLDDNIKKSNSPYSLSLGWCARMSGPAIGYIIGYFSLKVFVNPGEVPEGKASKLCCG